MKEQDKLDALAQVQNKASSPLTPSSTPPSKRTRRAIDIEALSAEARALEEIGDTNWIGRLLEYRAVNRPVDGLKYIDNVVGTAPSRFSYTAILAESSQPFGGTASFAKKKDAKQYASKRAIDWLIENNFMPANGVKFPKPKAVIQTVPNPKVTSSKVASIAIVKVNDITPEPPAPTPKATSLAGKIPELCTRLGFTVPRYEITRVSEQAPLYSGYAHFNGDPRIEGKIGEVKDIFGQKNAKEMIAETLHTFLKDIERQRMAAVDNTDNPEADTSSLAAKAQA